MLGFYVLLEDPDANVIIALALHNAPGPKILCSDTQCAVITCDCAVIKGCLCSDKNFKN